MGNFPYLSGVIRARKLGETVNRQRMIGRHCQLDFQAREVHDRRAATAHCAADRREVVLAALLIAQMDAGDMRSAIEKVAQDSLARAGQRTCDNRRLPRSACREIRAHCARAWSA